MYIFAGMAIFGCLGLLAVLAAEKNIESKETMVLLCPNCGYTAGFKSLDQTCSSGSIDKCDWACIAHR
jgi:hypothetical protein